MTFRMKGALVACAMAVAAGAGATAAKADQFINILTGGTAGVYYPLGVALAKIYGDKIDGARTQVQSTKGSVENLNKRARRYLPRDTQLAALSNRNMKAICDRLNGTPRKCLGWRTPTEAFREEMMKLR